MSNAAATLNGNRVTSARVNLPQWGAWYADVNVDGEVTLTGAVTLVVGDLTLKGTVLAGGPAMGRSSFHVVGGAGGWGKTIAEQSYANDAGVKFSTIINDAAAAAGETVDTTTIPAGAIGASWVRRNDSAVRVLELLTPGAWYIREDGVTCFGKRASAPLQGAVTHEPVDVGRGTVTLASDSIATILPGVQVDGLTAVDVLHEISEKDGIRSTIWGAQSTGNSRRVSALQRLILALVPDLQYCGVTEYRVVTQEGERLNLQPVRVSTGMPNLRRVYVRPGVAGVRANATLGARVLVGFVERDPSRPYVQAFEDAEGGGFSPIQLDIKGTTINVGANATSVNVGALPEPLAFADPVVVALEAISTCFTAVNAGFSATQTIIDKCTGPSSGDQSSYNGALGTLNTAIEAVNTALATTAPPLVPTEVLKGT